jgi:hypothetical protein
MGSCRRDSVDRALLKRKLCPPGGVLGGGDVDIFGKLVSDYAQCVMIEQCECGPVRSLCVAPVWCWSLGWSIPPCCTCCLQTVVLHAVQCERLLRLESVLDF